MGCLAAAPLSRPAPVFICLLLHIIVMGSTNRVAAAGCYPALFAFGDSLSDTGNAVRTSPLFLGSILSPNGQTYFGRPAGRYSDGRLFIDFLAQSLGLPLLTPYLAYKDKGPVKADFSKGVNYAVSGATAQGPGYLLRQGAISFLTLDSLDVQLKWHFDLQDKAMAKLSSSFPGVKLPSPDVFSKAMYFLEIGGNDYGTAFFGKRLLTSKPITIQDAINFVPLVVNKTLDAIQALYQRGGRNFFLYAVTPQGCSPLFLRFLNGSKDSNGCLDAFNQIDRLHNSRLVQGVEALRARFADIRFTFADIFTAYEDVLRNTSSKGFEQGIQTCCGGGPTKPYGFQILRICGPISYKCPDPSKYLVWDGIHLTEGFNRYLFNSIVSGKYVHPPQNGLSLCASYV